MGRKKSYIEKVCSVPENAMKPVKLEFQNGKLNSVSKKTTKCRPVFHKTKRSNGIVVAASGNIYHGLIKQEELTDTYLFVRNRDTNKVRIIPIDHVLLQNHIYSVLDKKSKLPTIPLEDGNKILLQKFGGRKANRYVKKIENMSMNVDLLKDYLENMNPNERVTNDKFNPIGS